MCSQGSMQDHKASFVGDGEAFVGVHSSKSGHNSNVILSTRSREVSVDFDASYTFEKVVV